MHPNIKALRQALAETGVAFSSVEGFEDIVMVAGHPFMYALTPFNTHSGSAVCLDKAMLFKLLEGRVRMPRTVSIVDPNGDYPKHIKVDGLEESFKKASGIPYPLIVKMNAGDAGRNVYKVDTEVEARDGIAAIFNKASKNYDFIALVQEYIKPVREIRAVIVNGKFSFAYDRKGADMLSGEVADEVSRLSKIILGTVSLSWCALDFIESESGELYFLEANTRPGFEGFLARHGDRLLVDAYKDALKSFLEIWR
ncbi:MAG TPA: hypothetical protein VGE35_00615 [Candidatus Paceibacterota bacterium]